MTSGSGWSGSSASSPSLSLLIPMSFLALEIISAHCLNLTSPLLPETPSLHLFFINTSPVSVNHTPESFLHHSSIHSPCLQDVNPEEEPRGILHPPTAQTRLWLNQ